MKYIRATFPCALTATMPGQLDAPQAGGAGGESRAAWPATSYRQATDPRGPQLIRVSVLVLMEDVAADEPAQGASDEDVRGEMLASDDAGNADAGG